MTQKITCTLGAIAFATASAFAMQSPAQNPTPSPAGRAGTPSPVTVSGCVERSGSGASATFKLTKVERAPVSSTAAPGAGNSPSTSPQPSTPSASSASTMDLPKELALKSTATIDLNQHANHKIEATGTIEDDYAPSISTRPAPGSAEGRAGAAAGRDEDLKTLNLTSLKMVSATCN